MSFGKKVTVALIVLMGNFLGAVALLGAASLGGNLMIFNSAERDKRTFADAAERDKRSEEVEIRRDERASKAAAEAESRRLARAREAAEQAELSRVLPVRMRVLSSPFNKKCAQPMTTSH